MNDECFYLQNTEEEEGEEEDNIVNVSHDSVQEKKILPALILTPTRELAVQVTLPSDTHIICYLYLHFTTPSMYSNFL